MNFKFYMAFAQNGYVKYLPLTDDQGFSLINQGHSYGLRVKPEGGDEFHVWDEVEDLLIHHIPAVNILEA